MEEAVLSKRDGPITYITLNRPDKGNLVTNDMLKRLLDVVEEAAPVSNLIVLRGAGNDFCSGREIAIEDPLGKAMTEESKAQLEAMKRIPAYLASSIRELPSYANLDPDEYVGHKIGENNRLTVKFFDAIRKGPAAFAAAVNGKAAGFGCAMAILSDITIVAEDVDIRVPDPDPYFSTALVLPPLLERLPTNWLNKKTMSLLIYANRSIDAQLAMELDLASAIVPAAKMDDQIEALAQALSSQSLSDVKAVKQFVRSAPRQPVGSAPNIAGGIAARAAGFALGDALGDVIGDAISDD